MLSQGAESAARANLAPVPDRELDRLHALVRQADRIGDSLQAMIDRYHGNPPRCEEACDAAAPSGHIGNVSTLSSYLDRIEKLVSELSQIG